MVPFTDGINACRLALDGREEASIPTEEVIGMIKTVLNNNNFNLTADRQFIQTDGTAIGSRLGRNYACTYMGWWERQLLEGARCKPLVYLRYVDDIFGIWMAGQSELELFRDRANGIEPRIQVDLRTSPSEIEFLDVLVRLSREGYLSTDLYEKPSDSKSYLHFKSDHPLHTKRAVAYGLGMRLKRICSDEKDYRSHRKNLKARLLERDYPDSMVEKELKKVDKFSRSQLLGEKMEDGEAERVPLAVTFSRFLPNMRDVFNRKRHLLHRSERMRTIFPQDPMVAYKRGRNLKDMLVHSKTKRIIAGKGTRERVTESCGKECVICRRMFTEEKVVGARAGHVTTFDRTIGCRSVNVIYGIWCEICKCVCYVGETGGCLYTRIQNHLSSI